MEPWYRFEPTPIVIKEQPRGGTSTQLSVTAYMEPFHVRLYGAIPCSA